jgi:hypothetical protein
MQREPPTVGESISLGEERYRELVNISAAPGDQQVALLRALPWVRFSEVIDHDLTDKGGFSLALSQFTDLLQDVVVNQRGPGILGYFRYLELSFSFRADASFDPQSRVFRLSLGFISFINELEATCEWLESILLRLAQGASPGDFAQTRIPAEVRNELAALAAMSENGGIAVSGKLGLRTPVAGMLLRFLFAHELAHVIDTAESPKLKASFRQAVWENYQDALQFGIRSGYLNTERSSRLQPQALPDAVANRWATEFVADGLGFYTAFRAKPPGNIEQRLSYGYLQMAVELFFRSLVLVYRNDLGSETHPSPMLRAAMIRAGRRNEHKAEWRQFFATHWAPGFVAGELLDTAVTGLLARTATT